MHSPGRKMLIKLQDERGTVAVEAAFYFVIFFMLCTVLLDLSAVFLNKGHIERINHSLSSVLRERTTFYKSEQELSSADLTQINQLAKVLLADTRVGENYRLTLDAIYFKKNKDKKVKIVEKTFSMTSPGVLECKAAPFVVNDLTKLAAWSSVEAGTSIGCRSIE